MRLPTRRRRGVDPGARSGVVPSDVMPPETVPVGDIETIVDQDTTEDRPWLVIVWNDPINLMSFVTFVLQKLFGYSKEKATALMLDIHHKGGPWSPRAPASGPSSTSTGSTSTACGRPWSSPGDPGPLGAGTS